MFKKSESGRNVVEMIAIIVLMALLIALGLWGFRKASLSAKVSTMTKDMSTAITERRYQIAQGGTSKEHPLDTKVGSTQMVVENRPSERDFFITLQMDSADICEEMKKFSVFKPKMIGAETKSGADIDPTQDFSTIDCTQVSALKFYFDPNTSGDQPWSPDPLKGKCDGVTCDLCKSCDPKDGVCKNDDKITKGNCGICKNGSVVQNPSVSLADCEKCNNTTWQIEGKPVDTFCGTCGKCKADRSCDDNYQDTWTGRTWSTTNTNCCLDSATYTYCPLNESEPTSCEKDKEETEYSGESDKCDYKKTVTNACTGVTTSVTYPNNGNNCGECRQCNADGECISYKQSLSPKKLIGNCCKDEYCSLTETPGTECTDDIKVLQSTDTTNVCKTVEKYKNKCTDATVTEEKINSGSCGDCGTCKNGTCDDPGWSKDTFYHLVNGVCTNSEVSYCPGNKPDECTTCPSVTCPAEKCCTDGIDASGCPTKTEVPCDCQKNTQFGVAFILDRSTSMSQRIKAPKLSEEGNEPVEKYRLLDRALEGFNFYPDTTYTAVYENDAAGGKKLSWGLNSYNSVKNAIFNYTINGNTGFKTAFDDILANCNGNQKFVILWITDGDINSNLSNLKTTLQNRNCPATLYLVSPKEAHKTKFSANVWIPLQDYNLYSMEALEKTIEQEMCTPVSSGRSYELHSPCTGNQRQGAGQCEDCRSQNNNLVVECDSGNEYLECVDGAYYVKNGISYTFVNQKYYKSMCKPCIQNATCKDNEIICDRGYYRGAGNLCSKCSYGKTSPAGSVGSSSCT